MRLSNIAFCSGVISRYVSGLKRSPISLTVLGSGGGALGPGFCAMATPREPSRPARAQQKRSEGRIGSLQSATHEISCGRAECTAARIVAQSMVGLVPPRIDEGVVERLLAPSEQKTRLIARFYWSRKTSIGSTRAARTAGIAQATADTAASKLATSPNVSG